jgi:DNA-binding NarL/FixJ family response regulator
VGNEDGLRIRLPAADDVTRSLTRRPDAVLMDIRMPRMDGLTATRRILGRRNPPKIAVLTTFDLDEDVFEALEAGAHGFLPKDTPPRDILAAVRAVDAGTEMLSPAVTRRLIADYVVTHSRPERDAALARINVLSDREREILVLIGRGQSNADAAAPCSSARRP